MKMSFTYRFEAAHRLISSASSHCKTPHGHTWYVTLSFSKPTAQLNDAQMLAEFGQAKKAWKQFIHDTVDHSFFHHFQDPLLPALHEHAPEFRGIALPGDPTTELMAVLFLAKAQSLYAGSNFGVEPSSIQIQETPTNSISLERTDSIFSTTLQQVNSSFQGWWQTQDINSRGLEVLKPL